MPCQIPVIHVNANPEPVFLNVYGAQISIPRHQFRQPMYSKNPYFKTFMKHRNRFQGMNSASVPSPHRLFKNTSSGYIGWQNSFLVNSWAPCASGAKVSHFQAKFIKQYFLTHLPCHLALTIHLIILI